MATETFLSHWIFTKVAFPFLLIFFIVFAILEKTNLFGKGKQINALIAFVIGLIFVTVASPVLIVENLILFLTVALVVVFVVLLIWGFLAGGEVKFDSKAPKWIAGGLVIIALLIFISSITGFLPTVVDALFKQNWSSSLWTNVLFVVVIAVALALVLKGSSGGSGK